MKTHRLVTPLIQGLIIAACCTIGAAAHAAPAKPESTDPEANLRRPYAYFANGESVGNVLQNLAKNFGLTLKLSGTFKESISGRVGGDSAAEMLNRLSEMYGFNWFIFGNTLYVSRGKDRVVQRIRITPGAAESLKQALSDIGLITPRFGWGAVPEEDAVIVTGPREYVNLVTTTIAKLESGDTMTTMVFRLKYASVEDRRIQLRDKEIVTKGVATILINLLTRQTPTRTAPVTSPNGGTTTAGQPMQASPGKLYEGTGAEPSRNQPGEQARSNANGPTIESDPRLNAVIIRDHISKQKMYADLIAELDVPSQLVEIEASIIDIKQEKLDALGTTWSYGSRRFGITSAPTGENAGFGLRFGSGDSTSVVRDLRGFNATLRALESTGDAKVLAKPVVLTMDNLGAILDLTDTTFSSVSGERVANIVPVTVGTLLRVTPHVINEDVKTKIQLAVDIEDGSQVDPSASSVARVKKTNISTQAIIEPTQSLLIAGYSLEKEESTMDGIPVLGKLPVIGTLFSNRSNSSSRFKRLFLITPRLTATDHSAIASLSLPELAPKVSFNIPSAPVAKVEESKRIEVPQAAGPSVDAPAKPAESKSPAPTDPIARPATPTLQATRVAPPVSPLQPKLAPTPIAKPASVSTTSVSSGPAESAPAPSRRITAFSKRF
ncbi:MAG: hypothetical protein RIR70_1138 [Pseudomonadota bacterium]